MCCRLELCRHTPLALARRKVPRKLRSASTRTWEAAEGPAPLPMRLQSMLIADAQHRIHVYRPQRRHGRPPVAGVVGQLNEVKPTLRMMSEMIEGFVAAIERLNGLTQEE